MTGDRAVRLEFHDKTARLVLNDPGRRNALSRAIVRGLFAGLDQALREGARAIVIAADGPAFCAGANIDDLGRGWMEGQDPTEDPALLFRHLGQLPCPVIAAVHGAALGGGLELSLSCDLVVAADSAWFAMPELGHGVIPNTGLALLQRQVGMRRALEMVLTRRRVDAREAWQIGLINRVVADGELPAQALQLAHAIVDRAPPGALRAAKSHLYGHATIDWERVIASPRDVPAAEWREGLDAFSGRRRPDYERFWRHDRLGNPGDRALPLTSRPMS